MALLVMDFQQRSVDRVRSGGVIDAAVQAVAVAREHEVPVAFIQVAFRPGYPEISPANRTFSALAAAGDDFVEGSAATRFHPALTPAAGDIVITKKRIGAFTGGDLEVVLRAREINHLVLSGVSTSGVVLTTVREAADRDYKLTVLADACADADAEVHRLLVEKIFPRQADVLSVAEWAAQLDER